MAQTALHMPLCLIQFLVVAADHEAHPTSSGGLLHCEECGGLLRVLEWIGNRQCWLDIYRNR